MLCGQILAYDQLKGKQIVYLVLLQYFYDDTCTGRGAESTCCKINAQNNTINFC